MKAAFYLGIRKPWYVGLANILIRIRLRTLITHCEIVFEPGDNVDDLLPKVSQEEDNGFPWCASSAAADTLPKWSKRRAGSRGGIRLKQINVNSVENGKPQWELIDLPGADARKTLQWFLDHEGALYDWQGIFGFVAWIIPEKKGRFRCDESCGEALGIENAATLTPPLLRDVLKWRYSAFTLSDNIMKQ